MLRKITYLKIIQQPSKEWPDRKAIIKMNFVTKYEVNSSWENLTSTATITLPKNIRFLDNNNKLKQLGDPTKPLGGFGNNPPNILRGDKIIFDIGYKYYDKLGNEVIQSTGDMGTVLPKIPPPHLFEGYIAKVSAKKPFVLECEDEMWKLGQLPAPDKVWNGYSLQSMAEEMLKGTIYTVSKLSTINIQFDIGYFATKNMTVRQAMEKVRRDLKMEVYMRGTELRIGYPVYDENEANNVTFKFQKNIIEDELDYQRKDDMKVSAIVCATYEGKTGSLTADGFEKTKKIRKELFVYQTKGEFQYKVLAKGEKPPPNDDGYRFTLEYVGNISNSELFEKAVQELQKSYYTGLKGSLTTFGMPYVKHGDNITLYDSPVASDQVQASGGSTLTRLPDRNGIYKCKAVKHTGGAGEGLRQQITLHYKI